MQRRSSSSAGAIYLDSAARIDELRQAADLARKRVPAIRQVILFGSLASGNATPRSDADILIIVENSPHERPRDRVPEMLRALSPLPCPIDLFVLTCDEMDRYRSEGSPLVRVALTSGIALL
jgi:predicted nucleotidyltransferase